MSKILISYFSEYGNHTYKGISEELISNGNDVLLINWNKIITFDKMWGNTKILNTHISIIEKIKKYSPDLLLNFNFSCPLEVLSILKCPICIIDADNPHTFWNESQFRNFINTNNNFYFWGLQSCSREKLEKFLNRRLSDKICMWAPMATTMRKSSNEYTYERNILFVGSNWYGSYPIMLSLEGSKLFELLYKEYKKNFDCDIETIVNEFYLKYHYKPTFKVNSDLFCWHFAGQERLKYLSVLTDLGIEIFGNNWKSIGACFDMDISLNSQEGTIDSYNILNNLYNTSKISVNFSHPQAPTGVSWRVFDIMASNSCLLVEDKPDWREYFEPYLSNETINSVIYKDRFDMRTKAIKLLNDEDLRLRCVADLNNAIEKNGRWVHRFTELQKLTNIKLVNVEPKKGEETVVIIPTKKASVNFKKHSELKKKYKIFVYSLLIAFAQIPILNLLLGKSKRDKLLNKVIKYWR